MQKNIGGKVEVKMSKNSIIFFILISFLSIALVACGSGNNDSDSSTGTGAEGGILIIDEMSDAVSMDPHGSNDATSANVYYNIYETLVVQDMEMNLQPGLATEWFQDEEDPTRWEFSLREGVKFHAQYITAT